MEFSKEQLKKLSVLFGARSENQLTIEEIRKFIQLDTIDDCKQYLRVMLDFYFDVILGREWYGGFYVEIGKKKPRFSVPRKKGGQWVLR